MTMAMPFTKQLEKGPRPTLYSGGPLPENASYMNMGMLPNSVTRLEIEDFGTGCPQRTPVGA